ncbi:uncharacterized protein LOC119012173 isoform X2 [Acanthopagrus latus]|uniref:uncharacterized protein LOC119012173 isoform X2 n=1 Tax=Acanthopagrus latus TaxID=8177 RepID=UPI00187BEA8E|nr:uncharacterized protein LOC119012173 isoform X2 [Acanthopagrus latus]
MGELRWTKMSLFLIMLLQFTAVTGREAIVKVGDEVTLSCGNVDKDHDSCDDIEWLFADSGGTPSVVLIRSGQIGEHAGDKSDRLRVTEKNCSLVLKNVTAKDVGQYTCIPHTNLISVITMTEHQKDDEVTLTCSLLRYGPCKHKVKWLREGRNVNEDHANDSQPGCSVTYSLSGSSTTMLKSKLRELFKCELTNLESKSVETFSFSRQSSAEKPGDATTAPTTSVGTTATSKITETGNMDWLLYIIAATGVVVALLTTVVVVVICKRNKGNKKQVDENTGQSLNLAVTESAPETSRDTVDPEDGVSYASVSYIKNTSKTWVKNNGDEDDTVTYSTVKASSSSAGAPDDASGLYTTINKPQK